MRTSDADILIIPGHYGSGLGHWQTRWQQKLRTARRVEQADYRTPKLDDWVATLEAAVAAAQRPAILVAHSLGVALVAHAAPALPDKVAGAFLVAAPSDGAILAQTEIDAAFAPVPRVKLPFPAHMIASRTDPYATYPQAEELASALGATLHDAGDAGHINEESGHGPWPEGLMSFGGFLTKL